MATVLHECDPVEAAVGDPVDLAADYEVLVEAYEPTWQDWEDYRLHLEREEAAERCEDADRAEELERIRRADFNAARSAACQVRGIAACLGAYGLDSIGRRLLAASDDMLNLVTKYA